ncbi:MgtC/SapB family protein [Niabella defluvii]|nr:MgtC/SapB family protein [Niabella sp. I65]
MKDKAAGLKTITLITLGSALFAIISFNIGQPNGEATRIASYIVSGIGFLGAGVIFKDGVNVSGLTTASVIWLASAVGMAIGFGEVFLSLIFLGVSLLFIYFGSIANRFFPSYKLSRMLMVTLPKAKADERKELVVQLKPLLVKIEEKKLSVKEDKLYIYFDITVRSSKLKVLEDFLLSKESILAFEM